MTDDQQKEEKRISKSKDGKHSCEAYILRQMLLKGTCGLF